MHQSGSEPRAVRELAEAITDSHFASVAFEHFARTLSFHHPLPLLTEIYAVIRTRHGPVANRDELPGFYAPWRLIVDNRPAEFQCWLAAELKKCLPGHLRLATNIYYYWLGTDRHTRAERESARHAIFETLRASWTTMPSADIAAGFDPNFPYILFHLVFTSDYTKPQNVPLGNVDDWAWSGPILLATAQSTPSVMLPQILIALNDDSKRDGPTLNYEFDSDRLNKWFGAASVQLLSLVASGFEFTPGTTEQSKYMLNLAIQKAKDTVRISTPPTKQEPESASQKK